MPPVDFSVKGNWYESGDDGSYRYRNTDGGQYEYDGDGYGYYRLEYAVVTVLK